MIPLCSADDLPRLDDRVALVTGANSGIGLETARGLARAGAHVVMACRSPDRGAAARDSLRAAHPGVSVELLTCDLADLSSVARAAEALQAQHPRLDLLINNAGVMALPYRQTADGFEMQLGTNHLGHFALTLRLREALLAAPAPRVVTVTSLWQRVGRMRMDDLQWRRGYQRWPAYGQSKLANVLFACELQRRAGGALISLSAHPGYASTPLHVAGPQMEGSNVVAQIMKLGAGLFAQSAAKGALPSLAAATAPSPEPGGQFGPRGPGEIWGCAVPVKPTPRGTDPETGAALWEVSESLTGLSWAS